ncbi:MAG TPA: FKBP-type peptidyl-prolyl cis-trans isomerase [Nitrospiria bacterium]|nr:FKBP-type peptidyl-prolyl cis-trans isomerase [Nitrospiria bacterium]
MRSPPVVIRWVIVVILGAGIVSPCSAAAAEQALIVEDGNDVSIEYTLSTKEDGVINSNVGGEPYTYRQGAKNLDCMEGVQKRLAGHKEGDVVTMVLPPEEGCGPIDPKAVLELDLYMVPEHSRKPGQHVKLRGPHGVDLVGVVKEIKKKTAVIDINHPLAGKTLHFDVRIVKIAKGEPSPPYPRPPDSDYR